MVLWLLGIAVCCFVWALLWKGNTSLGIGILLGVLLAWLLSYPLSTTLTETPVEDIPVWLPPLPLATIAIALLIYGAVIWFKGNEALPQPKFDEKDEHHH